MKICLACSKPFNHSGWTCPICHHTPIRVEGHFAFSPQLAQASEGYDARYFAQLIELEANNFWFRARNRLIIWALQRYFPQAHNFLEIGCGTGFVLSGIEQQFPHLALSGSEIFSHGLQFAAQRLVQAQLFQLDARQIPFDNEFDVIGAFDVLEHIKADEVVLSQMYQALRHNGGIIITVPQHPWLWSPADDDAHHVRRYRNQELKDKVVRAGFKIVKTTSFVSFLLPLMIISRLRQRQPDSNHNVFAELKISGLLNGFLEHILNWERLVIKLGGSFPVGGSLLLIAKKT